jgi:hypothetical protein
MMRPLDEEQQWADLEADPIVRPYALTGGRTRHAGGGFDLIANIETTADRLPDRFQGGPEHRTILRLCRSPLLVAEIATELELPVDVVRVLLGDLADEGLIVVRAPTPVCRSLSTSVLSQLIEGLHAL